MALSDPGGKAGLFKELTFPAFSAAVVSFCLFLSFFELEFGFLVCLGLLFLMSPLLTGLIRAFQK